MTKEEIRQWLEENALQVYLFGDRMPLSEPLSKEQYDQQENKMLDEEDDFSYLNVISVNGDWVVEDDQIADPFLLHQYILQTQRYIRFLLDNES